MRRRSRAAALLVVWALLPVVQAQAQPQPLNMDHAKASGQCGEQADGYLGLVNDEGPAVNQEFVDAINARRRKAYLKIAEKNGIRLEQVAAQAGQKLVKAAPRGEWVKDSTGRWKRK